MIRSVLVVADDPEFRELDGRLLAAVGLTMVGEADSVAAALVVVPVPAPRSRANAYTPARMNPLTM